MVGEATYPSFLESGVSMIGMKNHQRRTKFSTTEPTDSPTTALTQDDQSPEEQTERNAPTGYRRTPVEI